MKLIITEKPSVAQDFAKALAPDGGKKGDGFIDCGEYKITWAFGHLLKIDDSKYNDGKWSLDTLPLLPFTFPYQVEADKKKQLFNIIKLLKEATSYIVATDAGREGELIAREILIYSKIGTTNGFRFWSSEALTPNVVLRGIQNIKPLSAYDSLYYAAAARQVADWIVGVNFTRFFSIKAKEIWSLGRVQTPTLFLVTERDSAISKFTPQKYFTVMANLASVDKTPFLSQAFSTKAEDKPERFTEDVARSIVSSLTQNPTAPCINVSKTTKNENPPLLHSLTSLQREANRRFGYTAQQTLTIAQTLYETFKCTSYPRTDANHLAESSLLLASEKLTYFAQHQDVDVNRPGKRVFDTSKLTDHHAIIPLSKYTGSNQDELNVFNLVLKSFVSAFMKPHTYEETKLTFSTKLEGIVLISRGKTIIENGWKSFNAPEESEADKSLLLPLVSEKDICSIGNSEVQQKFTEPPKHITEDTLLGAMDKYNLGTPATRAHIIERLFTVSYLKRDKKNIVATEKGLELISILKTSSCNLYDVEITSQWENSLELIYKNNTHSNGYREFISTVSKFTEEQVKNLKESSIEVQSSKQATPKMIELAKKIAKEKGIKDFNKQDNSFDYIKTFIDGAIKAESINPCPCGGIIKEDKFYYLCETCKKKVYKEVAKKTISLKVAFELFKGKKVLVKGMTSSRGKKFDAELQLDSENKIKFLF